MASLSTIWTQLFPPAPTFLPSSLPSQSGRVFLVTGGASGIGHELAKFLFAAGGTVFITSRSEAKAASAATAIRASAPDSPGKVDHLVLDYTDLTTVKSSAAEFLSKSDNKLHVLYNNAGISLPAHGSKSAQGHDLITSTNILGPLLFTRLVLPALVSTASTAPAASVRVIFTASLNLDAACPSNGFDMSDVRTPKNRDATYTISKTGNWFLASELAREFSSKNILSIVQNPGNCDTPLLENLEWWRQPARLILKHPRMGAHTGLYAGLSEELGMGDAGGFVVPWGRKHPKPREDLVRCLKGREDGGTGLAREFVEWCEEQIGPFFEGVRSQSAICFPVWVMTDCYGR